MLNHSVLNMLSSHVPAPTLSHLSFGHFYIRQLFTVASQRGEKTYMFSSGNVYPELLSGTMRVVNVSNI